MGSRSRRKGGDEERAVVNWHRARGVHAERVPLSGAMPTHPHDVLIHGLTCECKVRGGGFKLLYDIFAGDNPPDIATVRQDRGERLYVVPERTWERFVEWFNWAGR